MTDASGRGEQLVEDPDALTILVEQAVRDAVEGEASQEDLDALIDRISEAVRFAAGGGKILAVDADALLEAISEAARTANASGRKLTLDVDALEEKIRDSIRVAASGGEALADRVNFAFRAAANKGADAASDAADILKGTLRNARRAGRDNVVMVRVDNNGLEHLNQLTEAGLFGSRSEAAAFLIAEGIKARKSLFDRINSKIDAIRKAKNDLRVILNEEDLGSGEG